MADYFSQGAGANFGPLGYGGGAARGTGNLGNSGYQWGGPTNVGEIAYQQGQAANQANPWGGDAGIRPYNTAISNSAPAPWSPPSFGNTLSPESWNRIAAYTGGRGDLPSAYAGNMAASTPSGDFAIPGGGSAWDPQGTGYQAALRLSGQGSPSADWNGPGAYPMANSDALSRTYPDPGPGSTAWDPNNTAYNMSYRNQISPDLGRANAQRVADYVNNSGMFANQNAGQALAGASNYESQGSNPFAIQTGGTGSGMFQYTDPARTSYANRAMAGDISPESQTRAALGEIGGGGYPGVYSALNNPGSTMGQMTGAIVNQFEQPAMQYRPREIAAATNYGTTLNSVGHGGR